jgi:hypothetical protein
MTGVVPSITNISTSGSATAVSVAEVVGLQSGIDADYLPGACYMAHPEVVVALRAMVGTDGLPVFPELRRGNVLCGYPVVFNVDFYAKFLISETLLPRGMKDPLPQKGAPPEDFRGDYGPVRLAPSADVNAILTSMTKEERLNFDDALAHVQKWYDSGAGAQGPVSFHPEGRAALWGAALAKIADHFHHTGRDDRAFFFTDAAWKVSKYPVFAFNAGILSMAQGDYVKARSLLLAYLDGYQKVLATSSFQLIDSKITAENLELMAQNAQERLTALDVIRESS